MPSAYLILIAAVMFVFSATSLVAWASLHFAPTIDDALADLPDDLGARLMDDDTWARIVAAVEGGEVA